MIIGLVEDNKVVIAYLVDEVPQHLSHLTILPDHVSRDWRLVNGEWEPPIVVVPVPEKVSRFQARAALLQVGLLSVIDNFVAQADVFTQLAWKEASEFYRDSPLLGALAVQLGMTSEQLDDLFRAAAEIKA